MKSSRPKCPKCKGADFELRLVKDEGLGSARCVQCDANYLLLDSADYWFDVIQKGYPRITRCTCKNESFKLRIDYNFRDDGDIDYIEIHSTCAKCKKAKRQLDLEVDYGGTAHLFKKPLVPCKNPKILYDLKDLYLLVTSQDMAQIIDYLDQKAKCAFVFWLRSKDDWVMTELDAKGAKTAIESGWYLYFYAMPKRIKITKDDVDMQKNEDSFWKRHELIRVSSRTHVCSHPKYGIIHCSGPQQLKGYTELGLSFYVNYANEFVEGEKTVAKSSSFRKCTAAFLDMLQERFVGGRSPNTFANPDVYARMFGDRVSKKNGMKRKKEK